MIRAGSHIYKSNKRNVESELNVDLMEVSHVSQSGVKYIKSPI